MERIEIATVGEMRKVIKSKSIFIVLVRPEAGLKEWGFAEGGQFVETTKMAVAAHFKGVAGDTPLKAVAEGGKITFE